MRIIQLQPSSFTDNLWAGKDGSLVEGTQQPYPFDCTEDGDVLSQEFWRGDPTACIGFQNDPNVQRVNVWWRDIVADPQQAVGKYAVFSQVDGPPYTYTLAIESVREFEVPDGAEV